MISQEGAGLQTALPFIPVPGRERCSAGELGMPLSALQSQGEQQRGTGCYSLIEGSLSGQVLLGK